MAIVDGAGFVAVGAGRDDRSRRVRRARPLAELLEGRQLLATITVTSAGDANGADGSGTLSLHQAIEIANGTLPVSSLTASQASLVVGALSTPNTIDFAIPGTGPFVIEPISGLPAITSPVVIDGYSQPGASPNTNGPDQADNAHLLIELYLPFPYGFKPILHLATSGSTVQGLSFVGLQDGIFIEGQGGDVVRGNFIGTALTGAPPEHLNRGVNALADANTIGGTTPAARNVIAGVLIAGSGNVVAGNFIGTDPTGTNPSPNSIGIQVAGDSNIIGGTTPAARNVISGNDQGPGIAGTGNVVEGNFIGTDPTGTKAVPFSLGLILAGRSNTLGGTMAAARNVISGNTNYGVNLGGTGNVVAGNFIGTDPTGNNSLPNGQAGLVISGTDSGTVGGTAAGAGNVISGNLKDGINISFASHYPPFTLIPSSSIDLAGNFIGTDPTGTIPLPNAGDGISIDGGMNITIGGTAACAGNVIAFNGKAGVDIPAASPSLLAYFNNVGNLISGNSIFANVGLGIDLGDDGVNDNNPAGSPTGPNLLQPYPVLTSASIGANGTAIAGTLDAAPSTSYTVEFFSNPVADPSGFGQGKTYLGSTVVTTDASARASFTFAAPTVPPGQAISATATDPNGNTSEFARDVTSAIMPPTVSPTSTTLIGPSAPSAFGRPVTFAAVVTTSPGVVPTGYVLFGSAGVILGEAPLNASGVAVFITDQLPPGVDVVAAAYLGDRSNAVSLSNYVAAPVTPTAPLTVLFGPTAASPAGQPATLGVVILPRIPGAVPTGTVAFFEGGALLGEAPVEPNAGAVLITDAIPAGDHIVVALYLGDTIYTPSLSNYVSVRVLPAGAPAARARATRATAVPAHPSGPKLAAPARKGR